MSNGYMELVPNLTIGEASQFEQIFKLSRIDEVVAEKKPSLPPHLLWNIICNECKSNAINQQEVQAAEEKQENIEINKDENVNEEKIEKIDEAPDETEHNNEQQLSINTSPEVKSKNSEDILERVKLEHKRNKQRQLYKRQQGKERLSSSFLDSESNSFLEWTPELEKNLGHNMRALPRISRMVLPSFNQAAIDLSETFQKLSEKYAHSHKTNTGNLGMDKELAVEN